MINQIRQQIQNIQEALDWVKTNESSHYERIFLNFVERRRELRMLERAAALNPAVAAYGESQKGKSYLMSNLLQKDGKPFLIRYGEKDYNFIEEMNPITDKTEATGVITRFSSFRKGGEIYSSEHPITMRTLSLCDIILILTDSYYNDIRNYHMAENIKEHAEEIFKRYVNSPVQTGFIPMQADELLEVEFYLKKYVNAAQSYVASSFFKRVALVADRIPVSDYEQVFGILWDNNPLYSSLFRRLSDLLARLHYESYIYLPVEAVLHHGINENTIMSVQCLFGLTSGKSDVTEVYLREGDRFDAVQGIKKCELSAICAEVMFRIPDEFTDSSSSYALDDITDERVRGKLSKEPVKKNILHSVDLLDFPGARSREKENLDKLGGENNLSKVFLRGKVAYIFNKYNESRAINVLLFCQDQEMRSVSEMPILLESWINNYVGGTPSARRETVRECGDIAPFFYIATKFNMDMAMQQNPIANERNALDGRWKSRFEKVLYNEVFNAGGVDWVNNWTSANDRFSNSYLLRDFKYSGERGSKLYEGFSANQRETSMAIDKDYYDLMRKSFCESSDAQLFFQDPAFAWDVAATRNNDGALYIIEQLSVVAARMSEARDRQFARMLHASQETVYNAMNDYRPANNEEENMTKNVNAAFAVKLELDITNKDENEAFFGHLVENLQLSEKEIFNEVHQFINSGALSTPTTTFDKYRVIRESCRNFEDCQSDDDRWTRLMKTYNFPNRDVARTTMEGKGIELDTLFNRKLLPQKPSYILADFVLKQWRESIQSVEFQDSFTTGVEFKPTTLKSLVDNLVDAAERLNLIDEMHKALQDFTNMASVMSIPVDLVVDICRTMINNFVIDFGYSFMKEEDKRKVATLMEQNGWEPLRNIGASRKETFNEIELTSLFDEEMTSDNALTPAFKSTYNSWKEYVFIAFLSRVDRPRYSADVTHKLIEILNSIEPSAA